MIASGSFYLSVFIITSLLVEFSTKLKKKTILDKFFRTLISLLALAIPSYVAGIRYNVGTDYFSYIRIFNNIKIGKFGRIEQGYVFLNQIVDRLNGDVQVVFSVPPLLEWYLYIYF